MTLLYPGTNQVSRRSTAGPSVAYQRKSECRTEGSKDARDCQVQLGNLHVRKVSPEERTDFPQVTQVVPSLYPEVCSVSFHLMGAPESIFFHIPSGLVSQALVIALQEAGGR